MRKTFTLLIALMALCVNSWATNTVITWDEQELATIHLFMSGSKTIDDVTVTAACVDQNADYVHFMYDDDPQALYCGFSMSNDGQLVFAPESGKLTSIVIHWNYEGPDPDLVPGSGWSFSESQLTWTSATAEGASSVVLKSNSSANLASGPISSIEFTISGYAPAITWELEDFATINVGKANGEVLEGASLSQTVKEITVAAEASEPATNEEYNGADISGDAEYGGNINLPGDGTLTFTAPEGYNLAGIVITYDGNNAFPAGLDYLTSGWTFDANTFKITWSGEAASSVVLAHTNPDGFFSIPQIQSIIFRVAEAAPAPDPREVPELKFYDNLTEATIIHDMFGWDFEPGTTYNPRYGYTISVKDGVYYYQDQPYDYWKAPSELEEPLPITYSLSNNDVIELTQAEGDEFSFNVLDRGDVVVTASTVGNTRFQPASITFTIHVIDGQAPTKECVLKFVSGDHAGELVPADFEFNLQTGDEVDWESMKLYEKDYPAYVYAPCTSIWGSRDYHVASLAGELKLRALMAGDDVFTVRYSRYPYPVGFDNGNFRTIEIPVHIKPSQPALVSNVDFNSSPLQNPNVTFNTSNYDPVSHEAQLAGTLTTQDVLDVMRRTQYRSTDWINSLPQTISFELAAGKGSFEVSCSVQPGYEVRIIRGDENQANHIITSSTPQPYAVPYDVAAQTPVVIFVAIANSPNPASKRAPAAKNDAPVASFSALAVTPTYPVEAKVDPDNAGVYYSTQYNETQKYMLPVGTEAYVATISGGDMYLTKVAEGGQVIPADEAFILKSNAASIVLTPTDAEPVTISASNDLIGTDSEKAAPANCYVLSGHSSDDSVSGVGFYAFSGNIPAHKAYIIYSGAASPSHRMRFIFSNEQQTTGMDNVQSGKVQSTKYIENGMLIIEKNGVRYNAQGQIVK